MEEDFMGKVKEDVTKELVFDGLYTEFHQYQIEYLKEKMEK